MGLVCGNAVPCVTELNVIIEHNNKFNFSILSFGGGNCGHYCISDEIKTYTRTTFIIHMLV